MKYSGANKYVTYGKSSRSLYGPHTADQIMKFTDGNAKFQDQYEVYELVPAKIIPAQAAKIVRA